MVVGRIAAVAVMVALLAGGAALAQEGDAPGRVLVWLAPGQPGAPAGPGMLAWIVPGAASQLLAEVPSEGPQTRVFACGPDALAPAGDGLVIFVGAETGGLYYVPLRVEGALIRLGNAHALACNGPGRAAFSPDGQRWAYIDYPADATRRAPFASGTLRILTMPAAAGLAPFVEAVAFPEIVAFTLGDAGAYAVRFFTDVNGLADEAALIGWDGAAGREITTLVPARGCDWTSAALAPYAGGGVILSLGQHCPGGSQWRLFTVSDDGAATEHVYMPSGGAYLPASTVNRVIPLADGQRVLATFPNGRAASVANLVLADLTARTVTLVTEGITVDTFPGGLARLLQRAPDGRFLVYVSSTANDEHFLHRLALDGSVMPVTISAGSRGDVIATFSFGMDGRLAFVAGGAGGQDNTLFLLPAGEAAPQRVMRGRFLQSTSLMTDAGVILLNHVPADTAYPRTATDLVLAGFDGSLTTLLEGRAAGSWGYPLVWQAPPDAVAP
ncbi:MAG: hypothetical protein HPY64_01735 [Anaerolineae bacterium]|nr:hypothetical protein [Anaerolineae bacterium]